MDVDSLFSSLTQSSGAKATAAVASMVRSAPDRRLNRINVLTFARENGLTEDEAIATFLHGTRIGLFDLSWNVICPGCSGVMNAGASLKSVEQEHYSCELCTAECEATLDDTVEVTFTVSPRVRPIAAHEPDSLAMWDYAAQVYWSSGIDLPQDFTTVDRDVILGRAEIPPGGRSDVLVELEPGVAIAFDAVTHTSQPLKVDGTPVAEVRSLAVIIDGDHVVLDGREFAPGPLRITFENRSDRRVLPAVWRVGPALGGLLGKRLPFLSAKRLLTHQTFRDLYRTDVLSLNQRLKITNLTFLFTDLKGSTELYERVGDLVAYDLVREHFEALNDIVAEESGAVVKTIGDAVMATFPSPGRAVAAALRMRAAMESLNARHDREDMLLKIGIHEGPCLAVTLNDRLDYFGQTVNVASRVQGKAQSRTILATGPVVGEAEAKRLIERSGLGMSEHRAALKGIRQEVTIYAIGEPLDERPAWLRLPRFRLFQGLTAW